MRYVLVTGGSRGIGAQTVRAFCREGYVCAFTYLNSESEALALQRETGALAIRCDMRSEAEVNALRDTLLARFHKLDVLVSNAGTAKSGLMETADTKDFDELMDVHVRGAFLVSRAFLPALRDAGGAIVLISSIWGQTGASCEAIYSAAKAALIGLTKALAKETAPALRVNCVAPGVIDTDMMKVYSEEDKAALTEEIPLGRLGTPEDVAQAVLFLASPGASYITGQVLAVNGGMYI